MIDRFTTHCATCGKLLGTVTDGGWFWHTGTPARLVNRRRFICEVPVNTEPPAAPPDDFRMRAVQRDRFEKAEYTVWEYPYVCNSDECMDALGDEWKSTNDAMKYQIMPAGRVLS